ncbi:MAG: hypothetical protein HY722_06960 [Planctomycetes bacterium]|nr:hypothetical protein [Planctomycetota bacterium]
MLRKLFRRWFGGYVRIDENEMVINKDFYRKLVNDSINYHKLLKKVEDLNKDYYLPIDLDAYRPLDALDIPDFLPEDL